MTIDEVSVLVVDDSSINRKAVSKMLKALGVLEIYQASDGQTAVRMATKDRFDLILMDLNMPGINGFEASRLIQEHYKTNPPVCFALSSHVHVVSQNDFDEAGMSGFIKKPFSIEGLETVLNNKILDDKHKYEFLEISDGNSLLNLF